jgi:uncharacterized membrane protein YjjP (DUF1212 family)
MGAHTSYEAKELITIDTPIYRKPVPALGLAVSAAVLAHYANLNAAQALGTPVALIGYAVAAIVAFFTFIASRA